MSNWIHVRTSDNLPVKRGSNNSPFEEFATDPNPGYTDPAFYFLPVVVDYTEPSYNSVHYYIRKWTTVGVDGTYEGHYASPNWKFEWEVVARSLPEAKDIKVNLLNQAYQTRLDAGYVDGAYTYDLDEDFLRFVSDRHYWRTTAVAAGTITAGYKIAFTDRNGKFRDFTSNALNAFYVAYGKVFVDLYDIWATKRDAILNANSLGQLDAITWSF